jgi:transforming growth factor-beta-induced protein
MKRLVNLFQNPRGLALAIGLGAMLVADVAHAHGRGGSQGNLVERLERDGRFTTLLAALEMAGLKDTVATGGVFTVLAPTDDAFAALPPGTVESLVANVPALQNILRYHVLVGRESAIELLKQSTVTTVQGNPILALREGLALRINGQKVDYPSLPASNGIIHPINGVLIPPATDIVINSLVDVLALDGRFTTLIAAVQAAGLTDALVSGGPLTLFAPTDEAFAALPPGTVESLITNVPALQNILLYHVLGEEVSAARLLGRHSVETLQGEAVTTSVKRGSLFVNQSRVLNPNVNAPNGIIHVIDAVLLPPPPKPNLLERLKSDGRFNTLVTALEVAELDSVVATGGIFTLFAPTDDAFAKVPADALADLLADKEALTAVLLYHVVNGDQSSSELLRQRKVATLQGKNVVVYHWRGNVYVNRSKVIDANLEASNGTIHGVNAVLFPPAK